MAPGRGQPSTKEVLFRGRLLKSGLILRRSGEPGQPDALELSFLLSEWGRPSHSQPIQSLSQWTQPTRLRLSSTHQCTLSLTLPPHFYTGGPSPIQNRSQNIQNGKTSKKTIIRTIRYIQLIVIYLYNYYILLFINF